MNLFIWKMQNGLLISNMLFAMAAFSMAELERCKEAEDKKNYSKWKYEYDSFKGKLLETDEYEDGAMKMARNLFYGFTESKEVLKRRYRELTKQYHPDNGVGDNTKFQCICAVYEELSSK